MKLLKELDLRDRVTSIGAEGVPQAPLVSLEPAPPGRIADVAVRASFLSGVLLVGCSRSVADADVTRLHNDKGLQQASSCSSKMFLTL